MKLKDWLDREDLKPSDLGTRIGRTGEAVRRYAAGTRIPDRDTMPLIVRETNGDVQPNDFFDIGEDADAVADGAPANTDQEAA